MPDPMFAGQLKFLSNFDTTPFYMTMLDEVVMSGEHAFNALKTTDPVERRAVLNAKYPGEAKRIGRSVTLREDWNTGGRVRAMYGVLLAKFNEPSLWEKLNSTGNLYLVETNNWHDQFWGSCFCPKHDSIPGTNMLGELLMSLRSSKSLC